MDGWTGEGRREARNGRIQHARSPSSLLAPLSLGFSAVIFQCALKREGETHKKGEGYKRIQAVKSKMYITGGNLQTI